jgi:hypothetical protein
MVSVAAATAAGVATALLGAGRAAPLIGWDVLAVVFCAWVWSTVWSLDAESTAGHAKRENPSTRCWPTAGIGPGRAWPAAPPARAPEAQREEANGRGLVIPDVRAVCAGVVWNHAR